MMRACCICCRRSRHRWQRCRAASRPQEVQNVHKLPQAKVQAGVPGPQATGGPLGLSAPWLPEGGCTSAGRACLGLTCLLAFPSCAAARSMQGRGQCYPYIPSSHTGFRRRRRSNGGCSTSSRRSSSKIARSSRSRWALLQHRYGFCPCSYVVSCMAGPCLSGEAGGCPGL